MNKLTFSIITVSLLVSFANAETESLDKITVVTTATKTEKNIDGVAASVEVVTEKDIKNMGAESLKDIIKRTPGIAIQYGTFPSASSKSKTSVSLRGMSANGTLFLINGKRLSGEVKNPYDLDRIAASSIERIEIVKGPMSSLYGADAVGGVINIITKKPKSGFEGSLGLRGGMNKDGDANNYNANLNFRGTGGKLRYSFYINGTQTDPYTERERTTTRVGGSKLKISELPPGPGYLKPTHPKTHGNPFYMQSDGSVKPKPLNPANLASDKTAAQESFNQFKNKLQANIKESYETDVTYREESEVYSAGTRIEYDISESTILGFDFDYMTEERWGIYNGYFHPMGFIPPTGHKKNPIVGHKSDGSPVSLFEAQKKLLGKCPGWDVPVNSYDDNRRFTLGADAVINLSDALTMTLKAYRSDYKKRNTTTMKEWQDFGYPNEAKSAASGMSANVQITSYEAMINYLANENHLITAGAEYRDEIREATVFTKGPGFSEKSVDYKAGYLQDEWQISDTLNAIIGARYDMISNAEDKATFRVGAVKNLTEGVNLRVNFAQGYRTPDIREMYINKQTPAGLQQGAEIVKYDLKPEFTNSYELGIDAKAGGLDIAIAYFLNDVEDRIEQVRRERDTGSYWTFENISKARTNGFETMLGYAFSNGVYSSLSWTELSTEDKNTGKDLEFNPERILSAKVDFPVTKNLMLGAAATYTGAQFYSEKGKDIQTNSFTLVDLNANYKFGAKNSYELFTGINNLFDEKVDKILGSNPGIYYYTGFRVNF